MPPINQKMTLEGLKKIIDGITPKVKIQHLSYILQNNKGLRSIKHTQRGSSSQANGSHTIPELESVPYAILEKYVESVPYAILEKYVMKQNLAAPKTATGKTVVPKTAAGKERNKQAEQEKEEKEKEKNGAEAVVNTGKPGAGQTKAGNGQTKAGNGQNGTGNGQNGTGDGKKPTDTNASASGQPLVNPVPEAGQNEQNGSVVPTNGTVDTTVVKPVENTEETVVKPVTPSTTTTVKENGTGDGAASASATPPTTTTVKTKAEAGTGAVKTEAVTEVDKKNNENNDLTINHNNNKKTVDGKNKTNKNMPGNDYVTEKVSTTAKTVNEVVTDKDSEIQKFITEIKKLGAPVLNYSDSNDITVVFSQVLSNIISSSKTEADKKKQSIKSLMEIISKADPKIVTPEIIGEIIEQTKTAKKGYDEAKSKDQLQIGLYTNAINTLEKIKTDKENKEMLNSIDSLKKFNELFSELSNAQTEKDSNDIQRKINLVRSKLPSLIEKNYIDGNNDRLDAGDMNPILAMKILSNIDQYAPNMRNKLKEELEKFFPELGPSAVNIEIDDKANENVDKELKRIEENAMQRYATKSEKLNALYDEYAREVVSRPIRDKLNQQDLDNARQDAMQDIAENNIALEVNLAKTDQDRQYGLVAAFSDAKYSLLNQEIDDITSRIQLSQEAEKMLRDTNKESLQLHLKRNLKELLNKEKNLEELELQDKKDTKNIEQLNEDIEDITDRHKANGMSTLKKIGLFLLSLTGIGLIFTLPYIIGHNLSRASELKRKTAPLNAKKNRISEKQGKNKTKIMSLTEELKNPLEHYQKNSFTIAQHNEFAAMHSQGIKAQANKLTKQLDSVKASLSGKVNNIKNIDNNIKVMQSIPKTDLKKDLKTEKSKYKY